jgi:hypothetical protein
MGSPHRALMLLTARGFAAFSVVDPEHFQKPAGSSKAFDLSRTGPQLKIADQSTKATGQDINNCPVAVIRAGEETVIADAILTVA